MRAINARLQGYSRAPYVEGLPEWAMFPDEVSRQKAVKENESGMMPRSIKGLLGFLFAVAIMFGGPYLLAWGTIKWVLPTLGISLGPWRNRLLWTITFGGYIALVYLAIRRNMPRALRMKLLRCGVPVCLKCGYDLRGLPGDRTQCPECGRKFGTQVQGILRSTGSQV